MYCRKVILEGIIDQGRCFDVIDPIKKSSVKNFHISLVDVRIVKSM